MPLFQDAIVFALLLALCVVGRLVDHVPNFTPVAAAALFGAFYFRKRFMAIALSLCAMFLSDLSIGFSQMGVMIAVYLCMLVPLIWRNSLRKRLSGWKVAAGALSCAIVFFLVTNFAVWFFGGIYSHNLSGLSLCYLAALPFFKYTLASGFFWSGILFGTYMLSERLAGMTQGNWLGGPINGQSAAV